MESGGSHNIVHFLENKTILVTGAMGFLGKVFLEKLLRVQPNIKKLYLLSRAPDVKSAKQRFQNEFVEKELLRILRVKFSVNLNSIISKITFVPGDVFHEELGIENFNMKEEIKSALDIIINFAATTSFDERYDIAFGTNTVGAKHVLCFAKECGKRTLLVHVSTAYVSGEPSGIIPEKSYRMGETLNGVSGLDIDEEHRLIRKTLKELQAKGATEAAVKDTMKAMGTRRARTYGWPNTYVFTKAMGEMLVVHLKEDLPTVIIRPAMVTSTCKEPFPGWIEGVKTLDAIIMAYGKGKLKYFPVDLTLPVDVIPADMVVNAILMAMAAHPNSSKPADDLMIYHVGSSAKNPVRYINIRDFVTCYFNSKPLIGKNGKAVMVAKPKVFSSVSSFTRYMALNYLLPLKGLKLANSVFCHRFQNTYEELNGKVLRAMRLVDLYKPYLFVNGIFDDTNTEKLRTEAKEKTIDDEVFFCDPRSIDWNDYFMNTHIPGIVNFCSQR